MITSSLWLTKYFLYTGCPRSRAPCKFNNLFFMFQIRRMDEKLTIQERVKLVFMFAKDGATYRSVAEEFNRTHPEREKH